MFHVRRVVSFVTLVAPRRGLLRQCDRPRDIFWNTLTLVVQDAQVVLRISIALRRRLLEELSRPFVALGHAFAPPDNPTRLPPRRLVAPPVRTLALWRAVVHGSAAGPIRVVLLGSRATHARAYVAYAVHGGGGRGRALECTVRMNDVQSIELCALLVVLCSRRRGGGRCSAVAASRGRQLSHTALRNLQQPLLSAAGGSGL
jgi:hypothetical protein